MLYLRALESGRKSAESTAWNGKFKKNRKNNEEKRKTKTCMLSRNGPVTAVRARGVSPEGGECRIL